MLEYISKGNHLSKMERDAITLESWLLEKSSLEGMYRKSDLLQNGPSSICRTTEKVKYLNKVLDFLISENRIRIEQFAGQGKVIGIHPDLLPEVPF